MRSTRQQRDLRSSAAGSSIRAMISSSTSRGAVVPRISVSPAWAMWPAGTGRRAHPGGLRGHPLQLVGRGVDDSAAGGVRDPLQDDQVAQPLQQVPGEPARIMAGLDQPVDRVEGCPVAGRQRVGHLVDQGDVDADSRPRGCRSPVHPGAGDELANTDSESRPMPPVRTISGNTAGSTDTLRVAELPGTAGARSAAPTGTGSDACGTDRAEHLLRLGGGDELHVLGPRRAALKPCVDTMWASSM
jgi:hypothetical protein